MAKSESMKSKAERAYFANERHEMLAYVPETAKQIIEFGCGEGYFAKSVKDRNFAEVWGMEFQEKPAKIAAGLLDKVITGDLNHAANHLPDSYFDCMIFNDVLEHLTDPWTVLRNVKPALKQNGIIVASIPNVRYIGNLKELLFDKDWRYKEEGGILDITHFRFFTKKSMIRLFAESGYDVTTIEGINPTQNKAFPIINFLSLGKFSDSKFLQFAVVAKPQ